MIPKPQNVLRSVSKKTQGQRSIAIPTIEYVLRGKAPFPLLFLVFSSDGWNTDSERTAEIVVLHQALYPYNKKHDKGAELDISGVQISIDNESSLKRLPGEIRFPGGEDRRMNREVWLRIYSVRGPGGYVAPGEGVWEGAAMTRGGFEKVSR